MQGRIVTFIKNIIRTIKNELKGPVISEKSFKINLGEVFGKEIGGKTKVEKKEIESSVAVYDLKDKTTPEIMELTFKKTCNNILFFENIINVENNSINFEKINVETSEKKIEKSKTTVSKIEIEHPSKKCKINKTETLNTDISQGNEKIYKIPQKIKGRKADDFYKTEYENLMKKVAVWALKNGRKSSETFEIEYVFEKIPVQCIKNIKYDGQTGVAELFFDEKNRGVKTMDFAIVLNRNTGMREKFFI